MPPRDAARDLLLGLLAFQNNFLDRAALLGAFDDWNAHPDRPLASILKDRGALSESRIAVIVALVDEHIRQHDDDPHKSLAAIGPIGSICDDLAKLADPDLQASLATTSLAADRDQTTTYQPQPRGPMPRFRVLRRHAKGGLGVVSVALDTELDRPVAFKEIQDKYADHHDSRARFVIEAEVTGKLEHPGIVPVYGLGYHDDGRPYYAMRFVEGDSLKAALNRHHGPDGPKDTTARTLELREFLRRFLHVCDAIAYAHSRGVLHRDLKPANVMLGPFGETLVVDWGLAKMIDRPDPAPTNGAGPVRVSAHGAARDATLAGTPVGTPAYMSPEQADGRPDLLGPATDVYGLGATLYQVLTGHPPIEADDTDEILRRVRRGEVPPPRTHDRRVPRALEAICLKAMAPDPSSRYADARSLASDLKRWIDDEPVTARRDPLATRAWRWARKHRTAATAAAAVLLVGLTALAVAWRREAVLGVNLAGALGRERRANAALGAANAELRVSNERVVAAKAVADRRLDETLGAVRDYYTGVGEEVLLAQPQLKALRVRLLEKPRQFYAKLAAELAASGADDARSRELLAQARSELGYILRKVGEPGQALAEFATATAVYERLAAEQPGVTGYRDGLAKSYGDLGNAQLATGATTDAIASLTKAVERFERLAAEQPGVTGYRARLATSYGNLGNAQLTTGATAAAIASYERSIERYERLAAGQPGVPDYRFGLATSYSNLGAAQAASGATAAAITSFGRAVERYERLAAESPGVPDIRYGLARSYGNLGNAQLTTGATAAAIASYERSIERYERLAAGQPGVPDYRFGLASNYTGLGNAQAATGATAAAIASHDKAVLLSRRLVADHPQMIGYQNVLGGGLCNLGLALLAEGRVVEAEVKLREGADTERALFRRAPNNPQVRRFFSNNLSGLAGALRAQQRGAEAAETTLEWRGLWPGAAEDQYDAACELALCLPIVGEAERDALAAEAMEALREAVISGWSDPVVTANDPDLDALRGREDFRRVLAWMFDRKFPERVFAGEPEGR